MSSAALDYDGERSLWNGFNRYDFVEDGCHCILVAPDETAPGRPWIWRAEFFDHQPGTDIALVERGFHLAYMCVGNTFGCPSAMAHWGRFHKLLTERYGLSRKPALEGLSRGGLYAYNWAAANPEKVSCIYADNPVCDFKSWPGGKGEGPGSPEDWSKLLADYEFSSEEEALSYPNNPIDRLQPIAEAGIPLLHVCGDADEVVPFPENTIVLKERYEKLGGSISLIVKTGGRHHPHSLPDPSPIVDFIIGNTPGL